jgi:hypothetical protein
MRWYVFAVDAAVVAGEQCNRRVRGRVLRLRIRRDHTTKSTGHEQNRRRSTEPDALIARGFDMGLGGLSRQSVRSADRSVARTSVDTEHSTSLESSNF